jgi:hypothetical protein
LQCPHPASGCLPVLVARDRQQAKLDFWQKTYYQPLLVKDDGHLLSIDGITEKDFVLETSLLLTPLNQVPASLSCQQLLFDHLTTPR